MKPNRNFETFELNKNQMNEVKGGVPAEDYCRLLHDNYMANGHTWDEETKTGFAMGWAAAGCDAFYGDICF